MYVGLICDAVAAHL